MIPFIIIAMMLVVQFGLAMYARTVISGATQDGAAVAALQGSSPAAGLAVTDQLVTGSAGHLLTGYHSSGTSDGEIVTVRASGTVVKVFPLFPAITVIGTGSATVEKFVPEGGP